MARIRPVVALLALALLVLGPVLPGASAQATHSAAAKRPVTFAQPTSIELEPAGTLLVVENNPGRLLRVDPGTGRVTVVVRSVARPYAVVRTRAGRIVFSAAAALRRVVPGRLPASVARADGDIGPVAAARDGTIYYATGTSLYRLLPGAHAPERLAPAVTLSGPHGVAVAADGAVLVSDTGHDRILRVDPSSGATATLAHVTGPRGIDVAGDGSIVVVDSGANRVLHLSASGAPIGRLARTAGDLYDVQAAHDGGVFVLEAGDAGFVRRISSLGVVTTVSR